MFCDASLSEVQEFSLSRHGGDLALSDNFTLGEFACHDGSDHVLIHPSLVALLQTIRTHFGKPVKVLSAYRTPEYNAKIGGAKNSTHKKGMAADITIRGVSLKKIADFAEDLDVGGIGVYPDNHFVHLDVWRSMRRWKG
jgi:uncharacterized protein YcbK (DUF882 family)